MNKIKLTKQSLDVTGDTYGALTALYPAKPSKGGGVFWLCECVCGNTCLRTAGSLRRSGHASCGCESSRKSFGDRTRKHGMRHTSEYNIWNAIKHRCRNKNIDAFKYYGGRGIDMCDEWFNSFEQFYKDMGDRPASKSIDRIDNDGNYSKENCKWSTAKEQANNRRPRNSCTH